MVTSNRRKAFLAEQLLTPWPWLAEAHRCFPVRVPHLQRDGDGTGEQVLTTDPECFGCDVTNVEPDVIGDLCSKPVVEGTGVA